MAEETPMFAVPESKVYTQKQKQIIIQKMLEEANKQPQLVISASHISIFSYEEMKKTAICAITKASADPEHSTVNDPRLGVIGSERCATCQSIDCTGHYGIIHFELPIYNPMFMRTIVKILNCVCNQCGHLLATKEVMEAKGFLRLGSEKRLTELEKHSKGLVCSHTHKEENILACTPNKTYITTGLDDADQITYKGPSGPEVMPISKVFTILDNIPQEDAALLSFSGTSRPVNMIMQAILVNSPISRPPTYENGSVNQDPMTKAYIKIIESNNQVKALLARGDTLGTKTHTAAIFRKIKGMIQSDTTKKYNRNAMSIRQMIQGKDALMRGMLMGKRGDFCGRTVLSPDPSLKFGQISLPYSWAPFLTKTVRVFSHNKRAIEALLGAGRIISITPSRGQYKGLRVSVKEGKSYEIHEGDKVTRWLQEGDRVVFNRQPTLTKYSMMSYEVVFWNRLTIGLHLSYTPPSNADFDGDEGNIWAPQDIKVEAEVLEVMDVCKNLMSNTQNRPVTGIVYDGITSAFLTSITEKIPMSLFTQAVMLMTNTSALPSLPSRLKRYGISFPGYTLGTSPESESSLSRDLETPVLSPGESEGLAIKGREPAYTTIKMKELYSSDPTARGIRTSVFSGGAQPTREELDAMTPEERLRFEVTQEDLDKAILSEQDRAKYRRILYGDVEVMIPGKALFSALLPEDFYYQKGEVTIIDGVLLEGRITKEHVGATHRSIVQDIFNIYGSQRTVDFLTDASFVLRHFLDWKGLSVGAGDCRMPERAEKEVRLEIAKNKVQVEALSVPTSDPLEKENNEKKIKEIIGSIRGVGAKIAKETMSSNQNAVGLMVKDTGGGAKGEIFNVGQMFGAVGQQFYRGERLQPTLTGGTRCLPAFDEGDTDIRAHGFCENSFWKGLTPEELFFIQAGGREGLMDTALKTSETGNLQRQLEKAFESLVIWPDGSARNISGILFQQCFGGDGLDIGRLMKVSTPGYDKLSSFIDIKSTVARLNIKKGFIPVKG